MAWIQFHLTVKKSQVELTELTFESLGALSVTFTDAEDEPQLEPAPGETPVWSKTRVTALFPADADIEHLQAILNNTFHQDLSRHLEKEVLEDRDWERVWLDNFHPMCFGGFFWVCPGNQIPETAERYITLDPGLAFGTGTHPTTAMCLEWLATHDIAGKTVLDFGCGSGILAISAARLGAQHVVAIDHDPQAIIACRSNAERNGVSDIVLCVSSDNAKQDKFDIVLANILANVLVDLKADITSAVLDQGDLVLSGVLHDQAEAVREAYGDSIDLQKLCQDEWCLLASSLDLAR